MTKSLKNYISEVAVKEKSKPAVNITPAFESKIASLTEYTKTVAKERKFTPVEAAVEDEIVQEEISQEIVPKSEPEIIPDPIILKEDLTPQFVKMLQESIGDLRTVLIEQQQNQRALAGLITSLYESIQTQNKLTEKRFESVDATLAKTSSAILETVEKIKELAVREINIPTPVVNVSLSEQKKIVKTVDRDVNGLISKITEETEQSVSQDK